MAQRPFLNCTGRAPLRVRGAGRLAPALVLFLLLALAGCAAQQPPGEAQSAPPVKQATAEERAATPPAETEQAAAAAPQSEPPQAATPGEPQPKAGGTMTGPRGPAVRRVSHTVAAPPRAMSSGVQPAMGQKPVHTLGAGVPVDGRNPFLLAIAVLAFAPGLFWLWFFIRRGKMAPGARRLVVRTFFYGMLVALPVAGVTSWVAHPLALMAAPLLMPAVALAVLAAPVIEEGFKFLVVRGAIYNRPEFGEPMEGIVYAAAAALGFASVENALYLTAVYVAPQTLGAGAESALSVLLVTFALRALLTVPGHALWSSMWGYALGVAKTRPAGSRMAPVLVGLLLAMGLHAAFNALVTISPYGALGMLVLVPLMWWLLNRTIGRALTFSPAG